MSFLFPTAPNSAGNRHSGRRRLLSMTEIGSPTPLGKERLRVAVTPISYDSRARLRRPRASLIPADGDSKTKERHIITNAVQTFRNTIIQGDCLGVLPQLPANSVDFILTDPPYLARYVSRDGRTVPNDDNDTWLKPAFKEMFRVLRRDSFAVSFYGWPHVDRFMQAWREAGFRIAGHFVFPKRYTSASKYLRYQHECAYLLAKGNPLVPETTIGDVIDWTYSGNKLHPTQKPLPVLLPLIETFSKRGDLVLDPFSGSGSSLIAAKMLQRDWFGVELDAKYHAIASERLAVELERAA
jgi:DNA modification methylase